MQSMIGRGMVALATALLAPARASATEVDLRVRYDAPAECPRAGEFIRELVRRIEADGQGHLHTFVKIRAVQSDSAEPGYSLKIGSNGGKLKTAELGDCQDVYEQAVLLASVARTDRRFVNRSERRLIGSIQNAPEPDPNWQRSPSPAQRPPSQHSPSLSLRPPSPPPPMPDEAPEQDKDLGKTSEDTRRPWRITPLANMRVATGIMPDVATGIGASLAFDIVDTDAVVALDFTRWTPQEWTAVDRARRLSTMLEQMSAGLSACKSLGRERLGGGALVFSGCVRAGVGQVTSNTAGGVLSDASASYATAGARLGLAFVAGGFHAELSGGGDLATAHSVTAPAELNERPLDFSVNDSQTTVGLSLGWGIDLDGSAAGE